MNEKRGTNGWEKYKEKIVSDVSRLEVKVDKLIEDIGNLKTTEIGNLKTAVALLQLKAAMIGALAAAAVGLLKEFFFRMHP